MIPVSGEAGEVQLEDGLHGFRHGERAGPRLGHGGTRKEGAPSFLACGSGSEKDLFIHVVTVN